VLADTERGLSGTQIERLLQEIEVADTSPGMTKWKRLFNALAGAQNQHRKRPAKSSSQSLVIP